MKRVALALIAGLFVVAASTTAASAAPINIEVDHFDKGGVTLTATVEGTPIEQQIKTGQLATSDKGGPGLCATGVIHTSCTPASEAAPQK